MTRAAKEPLHFGSPTAAHPQRGVSIRRILERLGDTVLGVALGDAHSEARVHEVVVHDRHDDAPLAQRALVLGVGIQQPSDVAALLRQLKSAQATALVVRSPVVVDDAIRAAAAASGTILLTLARRAAWLQVAALLRSILAEEDVWWIDSETIAGLPAGDLFALANAVSALVDAPVTIEDLSCRVLAFSGRQDEADEPRIEAILGREIPDRYRQMQEERGIFSSIYGSDKPVYVELPDVPLPRMAIAVRAGDETLGSIWAAVTTKPTPEREQAFAESAKLVALHMLRQRAGADVERRLRTELVATVLEGGAGAFEAARRLQLAVTTAAVLAMGNLDDDTGVPAARTEAERQRIADALALHLAAVHPRSACAMIGGVVYGILPVTAKAVDAEHRPERVAADLLERTGDRVRYGIGIGRIAVNATELAQSRRDADRALRVIRSGWSNKPIARIPDVYATAMLLELSDLHSTEAAPPGGALHRLLAYDQTHNTQLVASLRAWLDAFGDVHAAAASVHVHPNTFRYRLKRVVEISGLDLDDPEQRFATMLHLRLFDGAPPGPAES